MHRGAWQATVHRVAKSWTQLSDYFHFHGQIKQPVNVAQSNYNERMIIAVVEAVVNHPDPSLTKMSEEWWLLLLTVESLSGY